MRTSDFFKNEYVDQASYDNLRKFSSYIDGQKNASRKIIYTVLEKNIKTDIKVSQLDSKMAEFAEYLHGSSEGVIVSLAKNYIGANNVPLMFPEGNFGTRMVQDASAARYIYTYGTTDLFNLFKPEDTKILNGQTFEGHKIEPQFYVPNLPMLLINGAPKIPSSGYMQFVMPRNPKKIKKYINDTLTGNLKKSVNTSLEPFYDGFNGTIEQGENNKQWLIKGICSRKSATKVLISEIPIGYSLSSYIKFLDTLEDKGKIKSYKDLSDGGFSFEISYSISDLKALSDEQLMKQLGLIKTVTESYVCIDENNKVRVFDNTTEMIESYIKIKLEFTQKRIDNQIKELESDIRFDFSKYLFIKGIVENEIKVQKIKKIEIENQLNKIEKIIQKEDSYDYLLNMSIHSLTEERMSKLEEQIKNKKLTLDNLNSTSPEATWLSEI
jgi:DNA topoisomerase-2